MVRDQEVGRDLSQVNEICRNRRDRNFLFPLGLPGRRNAYLMLVAIFTMIWNGSAEGDVDAGETNKQEKRELLKPLSAHLSPGLPESKVRSGLVSYIG